MKLVVSDLSNIEGRILAYLAGEEWKLQAFVNYDIGKGPDLYNITASGILGQDPYEISKKDRNVFGKVPDLACFHPDTQVLTDNGYKRIKEVLLTDKLWDGIEWVRHDGVIDKGVRKVVSVDGISVTPEHLIIIGRTWKQAQLLATSASMLSRALATGSANLPSSVSSGDRRADLLASKPDVAAGQRRTAWSFPIFYWGKARGALSALVKKLRIPARCTTATRIFCPTMTIAAGCLTGSRPALIGAGTQTIKPTRITEGGVSPSTHHGSKIAANTCATSSRWAGGIDLLWSWIGRMLMVITSRAILGLLPAKRTATISEPYKNYNEKSHDWSPVYDIVNAGPRHRFTIKTNNGHLIVHNCGYEGGVGAFQQFAKNFGISMTDQWPVIQQNIALDLILCARDNFATWGYQKAAEMDIDETEWVASESVKLAWRDRHPATRALWYACKDAMVLAIRNPGSVYNAGPHMQVGVVSSAGQDWMLVKLPSDKYLTYFDPRVDDDDNVTYQGYGTDDKSARVWGRQYTYGGKMVENACQAVAGDVLKYTMPDTEAAGYEIVLTVHDEVVAQTPDTPEYNADALSALLSIVPDWAPGLPLAAAGFEAYRYKKED